MSPSRTFARSSPKVRWATQSGPMLLIGGKLHPRFNSDGPSRLVRNGVGVAGPGSAWFAISEEGVSFGRFARFFRDELGCTDALYLRRHRLQPVGSGRGPAGRLFLAGAYRRRLPTLNRL